jgi:hypothetical protein
LKDFCQFRERKLKNLQTFEKVSSPKAHLNPQDLLSQIL